MSKQINIYMPKLLSPHDPIMSCKSLPSLKALLMIGRPILQKESQEQVFLDNLPIADVLAKQYLPTLTDMSHIIAQPVHIDLDQSQGYIKLIDKKKLTQSIFEKVTEKLQAWAKYDDVIVTSLASHQAWLISLKQKEQMSRLQRPDNFLGESVHQYMPQGKLLQWFNESQMLLHMIPEANDIGLNSLWFWGNGKMMQHQYDAIVTRDWFLQTSAKYNSVASYPQLNDEILQNHNNILYVNYHGQQYQQQNQCDVLEETLFEPMFQAFKKNIIKEVNLYFDKALLYKITQKTRCKWWQKKTTMEEIFNDNNQT